MVGLQHLIKERREKFLNDPQAGPNIHRLFNKEVVLVKDVTDTKSPANFSMSQFYECSSGPFETC